MNRSLVKEQFMVIIGPETDKLCITTYSLGRIAPDGETVPHIFDLNDFFEKNHLDGPRYFDRHDQPFMLNQISYLNHKGYTVVSNLGDYCVIGLPKMKDFSFLASSFLESQREGLSKFEVVSAGCFSQEDSLSDAKVIPLGNQQGDFVMPQQMDYFMDQLHTYYEIGQEQLLKQDESKTFSKVIS